MVIITTPDLSPDNGDRQFFVELRHPRASTGPANAGVWRLVLRGLNMNSGREVNVWVFDDSTGTAATFQGAAVANSMKIGSPGAAATAITVGAYTARTDWQDSNNTHRAVSLSLNDICDFSSDGPLRDNGQKPDLVAPGAMIVSALSSSATARVDPSYVINPQFRICAGTSMATPFISGLIALLLQRDRNIDPARAKSLFCGSAQIPGKPSGTFDSKWGWGLIDADVLETLLGGSATA